MFSELSECTGCLSGDPWGKNFKHEPITFLSFQN
uniref:Uncharacterized protein n=1 Tax=Anguilla anguilla TaxID=7936 RepID=A0A0E9PS55_ANGAN